MSYATESLLFPFERWNAISDDLCQISLKLCIKIINDLQSNYKLTVPDHFLVTPSSDCFEWQIYIQEKKLSLVLEAAFRIFFFLFFFSLLQKWASDLGIQILFKSQVNLVPKHLSKSGPESTWSSVYLKYVTLTGSGNRQYFRALWTWTAYWYVLFLWCT